MSQIQDLGYVANGATATLYGFVNLVDGTGNPVNFDSGATLAVVDETGASVANASASLTAKATIGGVGSIVGCYELVVSIASTGITTNKTYFVVITAGTVSSSAVSLAGTVIAKFTVNANGAMLADPSPMQIDGLTYAHVMRAVASFLGGNWSVTDNGDGTVTIVGKAQDNATTAFTFKANKTTGAHSSAAIGA